MYIFIPSPHSLRLFFGGGGKKCSSSKTKSESPIPLASLVDGAEEEKMKIYVGTYKKYNEGSIFGRWMDLEDYYDLYEFYNACRELHQDEDDPEFMFQDFEDIPDSLISESWIDQDIYELVHFEGDLEALMAFISIGNYNCLSDYIESFNYAYLTKLESCNDELTALGYWAAEGGYYDIPEELENFVDYEKIGAYIQYDYNIINGYLFNNHY